MNVAYRAGSRSLVVVPGLVFLTPDERLARRLWTVVTGGGRVQDLLVELVRDGFSDLEPFVLVDAAGERVRVLVRGDLRARVHAADGVTGWTGTGVSTWAEHAFDQVSTIRVGAVEPAPDWLPIREGMVRCAEFEYRTPEAVPEGPVSIVKPATAGRSDLADPVDAVEPDRPEPVVVRDLAQTRTDGPDDSFDHLFESTIMRSVEDAAIRDVPDERAADPALLERPGVPQFEQDAADPVDLGDHDGYTITSADLEALRRPVPAPDATDERSAPSGPPPDARLELSTGDVVALDRDVVIGRRPQVDRVQGGRVPTVVTVPSPQQDVSRTHLRIGWSGDRLLATDLHSMNGTLLVGSDGRTRTLDGGVPYPLAEGDTLDIGDGVTLTLRLPS